ncbi:TRAP transporter permease [Roseinatronobacter bogoriensis]|uniref:C4-dicarboxylate ABC transporter permease n=1 Tax=Roseinatronobacter bogoriensis subsp. barguzinensis TaxID=441209 RepID=A0A2K8KCN0_9RHOB|nr:MULTISPECIES: TRAP transporter fused permease subunit [Rhodobaca]ATX67202.1 C4-dicarboxylate ABC transporter permease [Rhodobaca barguzinensis]MBB4206741.1 TRAP transporter 4TM/12TM fusion protein [Rhodobaca bogoriensis DSM 18756]TDW41485.1 TRAP transporter 4TM/12TM fusion protein [Rhodobaca barguzinensis]TDY74337.1 TRAP transporter 4TM/12TM fusion protein [Rhodobaca bogoriensis DSM 18756]
MTQAQDRSETVEIDPDRIAEGVDREIVMSNQRVPPGVLGWVLALCCILYTAFHIGAMNIYPLETWVYRLSHVTGGLILGFLIYSATVFPDTSDDRKGRSLPEMTLVGLAFLAVGVAFVQIVWAVATGNLVGMGAPPDQMKYTFGWPLIVGTSLALVASWLFPGRDRTRIALADVILAFAALTVGIYIIAHAGFLRNRAGVFPHVNDMYAAIAGIVLILEMTRRLAGLALVVIVAVFIAYGFLGPWLPGFLNHRGYSPERFFARIYTDIGVLGPTTAVSSTYIILFITFAAFLQASRVGEYFINFAFAAAGGARGGPAKVAIFGSGLMGMINGTSAGNVVSTGSLTIPLMKKVGYKPQTAASVEAAASSGGQILPPIMGAGAFIMAEITGIQYREIVIAAIIPAVLYFLSVYFMVDKEALKKGMKGLPRAQLPKFNEMAKQAYLFIPIIMLIGALYVGYSVIRAGTYAMVAAFVVSYIRVLVDGREDGLWNHLVGLMLCVLALMPLAVGAQILSQGWGEGAAFQLVISIVISIVSVFGIVMTLRLNSPKSAGIAKAVEHFRMIPYALEIAAKMSLQLVAVCAAAGVIVGIIAITGIGVRLSGVLMAIAGQSQLLALFFAMCVAIILGMGMPTTAAYAVAASVIAPGLIRMGIEPLTAHFFIFYYAVMSAITPPVALAAYAGAAIAQSDPMKTSVEAFKIGLAAFVVPFMFFYSSSLLMQGETLEILHVFVTASLGIYLLASAVQGWLFGVIGWPLRVIVGVAALAMIAGGWTSDLIGLTVAGAVFLYQRAMGAKAGATNA